MAQLPDVVKKIPMNGIRRIDAALEGNWNHTVTTIWNRKTGFVGFSKVRKRHATYKPSVELYFDGYWIGLHCFKRSGSKNVFDEGLALSTIDFVQRRYKI